MAAFGKSWRGGSRPLNCAVRSRVIALIAMVACLSMTAQAADSTLTLACQGTVTVHEYPRTTIVENAKPEPYSTGITVNLTARASVWSIR